jgi:hypothetical protein
MGENPPNGAFIDYIVPAGTQGPVEIELINSKNVLIRRWSSADVSKPPDPNRFPYPSYWLPRVASPSIEPGMHRFVWDFHENRPDGPLAPPGTYGVILAVEHAGKVRPGAIAGHPLPLVLRRDPRVNATDEELMEQAELAREIDTLLVRVRAAMATATSEKLVALRGYSALLAALFRSVESADAAPTAQERAVWQSLRRQPVQGLPVPNPNGSNDDD